MSLPPLYALRAFEVAARLNSFSKAAEVLNITPGAVSRHVRTLEMWFDCALFKRQGPRVEVSDAGRILAGQLSESFSNIEWACRAFKSENHLLRLKAPSTLTMRWLLNVLKSFRENHAKPKIEIASVWMDFDTVDFSREPYDSSGTAILASQRRAGCCSANGLFRFVRRLCWSLPGISFQNAILFIRHRTDGTGSAG